MCGFLNFFSRHKIEDDLKVELILSSKLISQRGPDDQGQYSEDKAFMQFSRLSIMDLSKNGHQPMMSTDERYVMTFNGEIYNFKELIDKFSLRDLRSNCDSEVLLESYAQIGDQIFNDLRGMYAFVIFDRKEKRFIAARDTFGIKPLYYMPLDDSIIFASEIKPLLSIKKDVEINRESAIRFLLNGSVDDQQETFFQGIYQVPPGHCLEGDGGNFKIKAAQKLRLTSNYDHNFEDFIDHYNDLLINKIKRYLAADALLGVSLSGGFDSSLLASLIHHVNDGQPLHMFSRGYENYDKNELGAAKKIGDRFGFDFCEAILAPTDVPAMFDECSRIQEHPVTSISILAFHKKYQVARNIGVKVLLEGHGGDEVWAGYSYYRNPPNKEIDQTNLYSHDGSLLDINAEIMHRDVKHHMHRPSFSDHYDQEWSSSLQGMQMRDIFGGKMQRSLRYVDRASMNEGIEVRLPFLDVDLVQSALSINDHWKISKGHHRFF